MPKLFDPMALTGRLPTRRL